MKIDSDFCFNRNRKILKRSFPSVFFFFLILIKIKGINGSLAVYDLLSF